ncbi:hypothetical protein GCM10023175_42140 [Pseudonocardia xishanensis]|uniref:Uncharacterized protein n=1 Tax=Pseudonocardia xishanensis TaxID=630995 RepID=A0ABP8RVJ3_9PSEU
MPCAHLTDRAAGAAPCRYPNHDPASASPTPTTQSIADRAALTHPCRLAHRSLTMTATGAPGVNRDQRQHRHVTAAPVGLLLAQFTPTFVIPLLSATGHPRALIMCPPRVNQPLARS